MTQEMGDRLRRLTRRIFAVVRRGAVGSFEPRKNPRITATGSHDETPVELFLPYGDAYWPPDGSEVVYFSEQGDEDLAYAVGATGGNNAPRPEYQGHRILWSVFGQRIEFGRDGSLTITAPSIVRINAPQIILNNIPWDTHKHIGVQTGNGVSGTPVP